MSVDLAFRYPYPAPQRSFIWHDDGRVVFQDQGLSPEICARRFAVLAVGSNRSPEQFTRKKSRFGLCGMIPVEPLRIRDYDVVYSAHIAPYGAIPAMLQYVPGALVEISITWLDASQLVAMDESEAPSYQRCYLEKPDMIFPERLSPMSVVERAALFIDSARAAPCGQPSRLSVDLQSYICLAGEWGGYDGEGFAFRAVRSFSPLHSRVRVTTRRVLSEIFIYCLRHQSGLSKASGDFHNFMQLLIDDTVFREDVKILLSKTRKPFATRARVAKA